MLIKEWFAASGVKDGKVFRRLSRTGRVLGRGLSLGGVRMIIRNSIGEARFKGYYSGHSLRVGAAQSLAKHGASLVELMEEGRWKSPRMAVHYAAGPLSLRSATARLRYGSQLGDANSR